jgi:hypothetical protein
MNRRSVHLRRRRDPTLQHLQIGLRPEAAGILKPTAEVVDGNPLDGWSSTAQTYPGVLVRPASADEEHQLRSRLRERGMYQRMQQRRHINLSP